MTPSPPSHHPPSLAIQISIPPNQPPPFKPVLGALHILSAGLRLDTICMRLDPSPRSLNNWWLSPHPHPLLCASKTMGGYKFLLFLPLIMESRQSPSLSPPHRHRQRTSSRKQRKKTTKKKNGYSRPHHLASEVTFQQRSAARDPCACPPAVEAGVHVCAVAFRSPLHAHKKKKKKKKEK